MTSRRRGLQMPTDVAVAATSRSALAKLGKVEGIARYDPDTALLLRPAGGGEAEVWANPESKSYRRIWAAAAKAGVVDELEEYGPRTDVDHVFPRSWAAKHGGITHVRLFPVWGEVNRSAGAGREKAELSLPRRGLKAVGGLIFAQDLQLMKMLGHPVGSANNPERLFDPP